MMQIQTGIVKYKDRSDIECTYGVTEDGRQYYFLINEDRLPNGNIIASKTLVEAIDSQVIASSIGVINENGEEIIACDKKAVKPVTNVLLVEKAQPTTESVLDAVRLRKDPLAATKLVTTPATIKDKMNGQMGVGGRFIFNDQFSEATICDLEGNNLIGDAYYSFIGMKDKELYFSKNTIDSTITQFMLPEPKKEIEPVVEMPVVEEEKAMLDVQNTGVSPNVIEEAIEEEKEIPVVDEVPVVDIFHPVDSQKIDPIASDFPEVTKEEETVALNDDIFSQNKMSMDSSIKPEEIVPLVTEPEVSTEDKFQFVHGSLEEEVSNEMKSDEGIEINQDVVSVSSPNEEDNVIGDVASTMSRLISQNKEQREKIASYGVQMAKILNASRQIVHENEELRSKLEQTEKENNQLKERNESLENTVQSQQNMIDSQDREIQNLRPQAAGNKELVRLLEDAQVLLGGESSNRGVEMPVSKSRAA